MNENSPKQRKKHQQYSPQFKDQALERAEKEGVPQTAKDLGIAESLLYSWRAKAAKKFKATTNSNHRLSVTPNLLQQKFSAHKPNEK